MRSIAGTYPDGNIYQGASEMNFNGTPPANGRGERFQVVEEQQHDRPARQDAPAPPLVP